MKKYLKSYSIFGLLHLLISLIFTKVFFPKTKLIRIPIDIRGGKFMSFGKGFTTGYHCRLEAYPINYDLVLKIGDNVQINDYVHITAMKSVCIGDNVLLASKIYISDCTHGSYAGDEFDSSPEVPPMERHYSIKPVNIEDNVWIGEFVSILPGVTIGKGSIIGSMSVVTKSIPAFCIAVGIPAKPIKKFNFDNGRWEKIEVYD